MCLHTDFSGSQEGCSMESAREGDAGLRCMPAFTLAEYQTAPLPPLPQPVASLSVSPMVCRGRSLLYGVAHGCDQ